MNNRHFLSSCPLPPPPIPRFFGPPPPLPPHRFNQFQLRPLVVVPKNNPCDNDFQSSSGQIALQIRGLSPAVPYLEREHLLYGLGATTVHNAPFHSVAFFRKKDDAQAVICRLHQRPWMSGRGSFSNSNDPLLRVEYLSVSKQQQSKTKINAHRPCDSSLKRLITDEQHQCFLNLGELKKTSLSKLPLNSTYFRFPPATTSVVHRISRHLIEDSHFYEQVLLLMLRFGLHPPFDDDNSGAEVKEHQLLNISLPLSPPPLSNKRPPTDIVSDESELETETPVSLVSVENFHPTKRRRRKKLKTGLVGEKAAEWFPQRKVISKTPSLTTTIEEVFEDVPLVLQSKLIKVAPLISSSVPLSPPLSSPPTNTESQSFGTLSPSKKTPPKPLSTSISFDLASLTPGDLVTEDELTSKRLPFSEWPKYKVFAGYRLNPVCNRLYLKNLHRSTSLKDLYRLFGRWCDLGNDEQLKTFNIVKLDKGRMRGQAFVSFPNEEAAKEALQWTNGYVGFGGGGDELKPIVVNFALSKKSSGEDGSGDHQL